MYSAFPARFTSRCHLRLFFSHSHLLYPLDIVHHIPRYASAANLEAVSRGRPRANDAEFSALFSERGTTDRTN